MNKALIIVFVLLTASGMRWSALYCQAEADTSIYISEVSIFSSANLSDRGLNILNIAQTDIKDSRFSSLSDLVSAYSGLFIKSSGPGSISTVSFRGSSASHTRISWNGMNLNNPMSGQVDFSQVPVFICDEISILPGGNSLSEGSGALGGSIRLKTRARWEDDFYGSLSLQAGSFGYSQAQAELGGGSRKFHSRLRILSEYSENNFPYMNPYNGSNSWEIQKNAAFGNTALLHELFYRTPSDNLYSLKTWLQDSRRNFPALMTFAGSGFTEKQDKTDLRMVAERKHYGIHYQSESLLSLNISDDGYFAAGDTPLGQVLHFDTQNRSRELSVKQSFRKRIPLNSLVRIAFDASMEKVSNSDQKTETGYGAKRMQIGSTAEINTVLNPNVSLRGLLRVQMSDGRFLRPMPAAGVEWKPLKSEILVIRSGYSANYRLPALNDLYWIPGGNPHLRPERAQTAELGANLLAFQRENIEIRLNSSFFWSEIKDWILWVPGNYSFWSPENIARVISRGTELTFLSRLTTESIKVEFSGNYSYTRASDVSSGSDWQTQKNSQLIYVPVHVANSRIRLGTAKWKFNHHVQFTGKRNTSWSEEESRHSMPAFVLHDAGIERIIKAGRSDLSLSLKMNNLFNRQYQAVLYRAMPGRNAMFSLSYAF